MVKSLFYNEKSTVSQPTSKKVRLLNCGWCMRKLLLTFFYVITLSLSIKKIVFWSLSAWVLCLFLNALQLREKIGVIYWALSRFIGNKHVNLCVFTLCCQRWRFVQSGMIRNIQRKIIIREKKKQGMGGTTRRSCITRASSISWMVMKQELILKVFPEWSLFIPAYFSHWIQGNSRKESSVLVKGANTLGLEEKSCGQLQCPLTSCAQFTPPGNSDSGILVVHFLLGKFIKGCLVRWTTICLSTISLKITTIT